ncbi:MAG: MFS transporter [Alphaproteobacteria bacterium]|nr:MFS transporter [Alphaproteobacteria bacterium]
MARGDWRELFAGERASQVAIIMLGAALAGVHIFIASTVMPAVVMDIGGEAYYAWGTSLYMLSSIVTSASAGALQGRIGARATSTWGGVVFLVGSLGCALAPNIALFLFGRAVQGLGGGLVLAMSLVLIWQLFPDHLRTRMLALNSGVWGLAALVGPLIGGGMIALHSWRGAFWLGVPLLLLFIALATRYLPGRGTASGRGRIALRRLALLAASVLAATVAGNVPAPWQRIGLVILAVLLAVMTFSRDGASADKMFPSQVLSNAGVVGSINQILFLFSATHTTIGVFAPLALQVIHGLDALTAGYFVSTLSLCWTGGTFITASWRGSAAATVVALGPLIPVAGLAGLSYAIVHGTPLQCAALIASVGLGLGICNAHLVAWSLRSARSGEEALTAGGIPTIRLLGVAFGASGAGIIANLAGLAEGITVATVEQATATVYLAAALGMAAATAMAWRLLWRFGRPDAALVRSGGT